MTKVGWQHFQYAREHTLFDQIKPRLEDICKDYEDFTRLTQTHQQEFFDLLGHSFRIENHPIISGLRRKVIQRLGLESEPAIFLIQSPTAMAMCKPHVESSGEGKGPRLVLLFSQHFFNDLNEQEQLSIIGHELGHLLFRHIEIPAAAILEMEGGGTEARLLKNDVRKWLTCCEVSCDMIGLLCCDGDAESFSSAMLKFTTGLNSNIYDRQNHSLNFVELAFRQFEEIAESHLDAALSTHPLTPLRLKIVHELAGSDLMRFYGDTMDPGHLEAALRDYNGQLDQLMSTIYPEIVPAGDQKSDRVAFVLAMAVALADGEISKVELEMIQKCLDVQEDIDRALQHIQQRRLKESAQDVARQLARRAFTEAQNMGLARRQIAKILRQTLTVAASDQKIEKCELDIVYLFACPFGYSKEDLVAIIGQIRNH